MLGLAEAFRFHERRWEFSEKDDKRFVNAAVLSLAIGLIYSWLNPQGAFTLLETVQIGVPSDVLGNRDSFQAYEFLILILPILLFPLYWASRYRTTPAPTFQIFGRYLPNRLKKDATWIDKFIPAEGGFALICLASTCKTQSGGLTFYAPLVIIVAWFLWENRPGKRKIAPWATHLGISIVTAFFLYLALSQLQAIFQENFINYIAQLSQRDPIPREAKTRIGKSGKLNLSGKIVIRAKSDLEPPFLLQQDFFDQYGRGTWHMSNFKSVTNVLDDGDLESWTLRTPIAVSNRHTIKLAHSLKLNGGRIPHPMGVYRMRDLPVGEVLTNIYGRLMVVDGPGLIIYEMDAAESLNHLAKPFTRWTRQMKDIGVPGREQKQIASIAREIGIIGNSNELSDHDIANRVSNFFTNNGFQYSTKLTEEETPPDSRRVSAISHFLSESRKGHCEYYATATTLLMRSAGIPARYVVGYSVAEKKDDTYIIRERDAHAWCQYYSFIDQKWHDLDTTPADWREQDRSFAGQFEPIRDIISNFLYQISRLFWIWVQKVQEFEVLMGGFLVIFFGFLIFRIMRQQNRKKIKPNDSTRIAQWKKLGMDSAFFSVITQLEKMGYQRADGETILAWITHRIPHNNNLLHLARLHNQYRFDPGGLNESQKDSFFQMVEEEFEKLTESENSKDIKSRRR